MANNVIGLFDNENVAQSVVDDLVSSGFDRGTINRYEGDNDGLEHELEREGIPSDEANYYVEGLAGGGALVSVRAEEADTNRAVEIMNRYANTGDADYDSLDADRDVDYVANRDVAPVDTDLDTDISEAGYDTARPVTTEVTDRDRGTATRDMDDEARLEVVEERLQIGKREVNRGGVRVRRVVSETPVEEQVTLRDETIEVDRRVVDRAVDGSDTDLFTEKTYEFSETDEEAVVAKEARVVEEIVIDKSVEERTETVRDTVRRTDVEVEQLSGGDRSGSASYDEADPSYTYAQTMSSDARYSDREWNDVESDVRTDWESKNEGGVWDDVKDSIRNAWGRNRR